MRKVFVILGATTLCACAISFGQVHYHLVKADDSETEIISDEESIEESEILSEEESEEEVINVDAEISHLSQAAKDAIEVIKTFLNQPIVIGGISTTLGAILLWLLFKGFGYVAGKRNGKYDKKINDLLNQLGLDEQTIKELLEFKEDMVKILEEIIDNTKNEKVKANAKKMLEKAKNGEKVAIETKQELEQVIEEIKPQAEEISDKETKIKEILEK